MKVDVVFLPALLRPEHLAGRAVVVLDVLRATTTMIAALAAGVKEIHVFEDLESAVRGKQHAEPSALLCGERDCVAPPGFDLGNSPRAFDAAMHSGRTVLMSTTNGTRAIAATRTAAETLIGALTNASAVAHYLAQRQMDVTLLCAGTAGQIATEDIIGAGAIVHGLQTADIEPKSDAVDIALRLFESSENDLRGVLRTSRGGRNVIAAGLEPDIDFAANLNSCDIVAHARDLRVTRAAAC